MIRFALQCSQDHAFEGWFRDGATFDLQAAESVITCPVCGDSVVRKAMMAPAVVRSAAARMLADAGTPCLRRRRSRRSARTRSRRR